MFLKSVGGGNSPLANLWSSGSRWFNFIFSANLFRIREFCCDVSSSFFDWQNENGNFINKMRKHYRGLERDLHHYPNITFQPCWHPIKKQSCALKAKEGNKVEKVPTHILYIAFTLLMKFSFVTIYFFFFFCW